MVNLWFTSKDLRYRWAEVKSVFWQEYERQLQLLGKRLLEESLKAEQQHLVGASRYVRVLTGFVFKAVGRENIRLFASEEDALVWLKEGH